MTGEFQITATMAVVVVSNNEGQHWSHADLSRFIRTCFGKHTIAGGATFPVRLNHQPSRDADPD